jgi:hypothetical protein
VEQLFLIAVKRGADRTRIELEYCNAVGRWLLYLMRWFLPGVVAVVGLFACSGRFLGGP